MIPYLMENGKRVPLSQMSYEQCERLHSMLTDKMDKALSSGSSGVDQLQYLIDQVTTRIDMYEAGLLKRQDAPTSTYRLRMIED